MTGADDNHFATIMSNYFPCLHCPLNVIPPTTQRVWLTSMTPSFQLFFIRLSASVTFLATSLKGMSTLRRKGDAILELDGDWLTLQTQLATTKIEVRDEVVGTSGHWGAVIGVLTSKSPESIS